MTSTADDLEVPTADAIGWNTPQPRVPTPEVWTDPDSVAREFADQECARLLVNCCLFDPPIEESEIRAFARRFKISEREAEIEIRRQRSA